MAGEYIITSNFNGYNIANKITISSWGLTSQLFLFFIFN
jgi:hypothetical protein